MTPALEPTQQVNGKAAHVVLPGTALPAQPGVYFFFISSASN